MIKILLVGNNFKMTITNKQLEDFEDKWAKWVGKREVEKLRAKPKTLQYWQWRFQSARMQHGRQMLFWMGLAVNSCELADGWQTWKQPRRSPNWSTSCRQEERKIKALPEQGHVCNSPTLWDWGRSWGDGHNLHTCKAEAGLWARH